MARANTLTWLPLDRWAEIIGLHPFHFNQLSSATYLPSGLTCGLTWFQNAWQNSDRISREDIAMAISGDTAERLRFDRPGIRELYNRNNRNIRGQLISLPPLSHAWIISGGVRAKTGIETAAVTRSDADGDGYAELVTVSVGTSVDDPDEIKVYYPGESGADQWEIRPINVSIASNVATITFNSWQIIDPDLQSAFDADVINAENAASYLTTVDVYRVYNDPQTQVQFIWEEDGFLCTCGTTTCQACQLNTQTGCFHIRDNRRGIVVPAPGTWDSGSGQFTSQEWSICRGPDQARVYYYSGWRDPSKDRNKSEMEVYWEYAVAYYAASLLDKDGCDCSNAMEFIHNWRTNVAHGSRERGAWSTTIGQLANRLGTTRGALYAINCIMQPGRRIGGN
jgi:hypothetical protein